mmetsp:Transcript_76149/g.204395  ORF Transcript_76149/g.204395 Transcript_76149/m.204395 type:complete len:122 (-) Transcript_76149:139-504(-)
MPLPPVPCTLHLEWSGIYFSWSLAFVPSFAPPSLPSDRNSRRCPQHHPIRRVPYRCERDRVSPRRPCTRTLRPPPDRSCLTAPLPQKKRSDPQQLWSSLPAPYTTADGGIMVPVVVNYPEA